MNVETLVAAAICRSVCPAASSPAIRAASAGVSFDAPFGPVPTLSSLRLELIARVRSLR